MVPIPGSGLDFRRTAEKAGPNGYAPLDDLNILIGKGIIK